MEQGIIGHERIRSFFERVMERGRLSHAYCFVGPASVGKRAVAKWLACSVLSIESGRLSAHPDVLVVSRGADEKTGARKRDITIEQIEVARVRFSQRPFFGGKNVAIVDDADRLNPSSANALLKTLEEPSGSALIVLLAESEEAVLPTIRSRCQMLYFGRVPEGEIAEGLSARGCAALRAREIAESAEGLPGRAISWMSDQATYDNHREEMARFQRMFDISLAEKFALAEPLFGDKKDLVAGRDRLGGILTLWEAFMQKMIRSPRAGMPPARIVSAADRIREARELLRENIHPRLLVERILVAMP